MVLLPSKALKFSDQNSPTDGEFSVTEKMADLVFNDMCRQIAKLHSKLS